MTEEPIESLLRESAARLEARAGDAPAARLEAEVLLAHVAGVDRAQLLIRDRVEAATAERLRGLVEERVATARPVAYLVGQRAFRDFVLQVDERVLVPRPETELLVERFEQLLAEGAVPPGPVVDRGTGSGNLALSCCGRRPVVATDLSADALEVARANADRLGTGQGLLLVQGDGLACLRPASVAVIVANPPYVDRSEHAALPEDVGAHEPAMALYAGEGGYRAVFAALVSEARVVLVPGGWLIAEVGQGQADEVMATCRSQGLESVACRSDLAGIPRVVSARRA